MTYTVTDELNFVAWIASNGQTNYEGCVKTKEEIEEDGSPKPRTCLQRIDFLRKYLDLWRQRKTPPEWTRGNKREVVDYIVSIAIPTLQSMRDLQLGDIV
jgi:hypothetical protein